MPYQASGCVTGASRGWHRCDNGTTSIHISGGHRRAVSCLSLRNSGELQQVAHGTEVLVPHPKKQAASCLSLRNSGKLQQVAHGTDVVMTRVQLPSLAMLYHAMPCHAMPCHAMLCYAMLCHAMPGGENACRDHGKLTGI